MAKYLREHYKNDNKDYVIGSAERDYWKVCYLFNGDKLRIKDKDNGVNKEFKVTYKPVVSPRLLPPEDVKKLKDFWESVNDLCFVQAHGVLTGTGTDQFHVGIVRPISIALDRSREGPYDIHFYTPKMPGDPIVTDDGSATGTGTGER